jgi:hypothetical protein
LKLNFMVVCSITIECILGKITAAIELFIPLKGKCMQKTRQVVLLIVVGILFLTGCSSSGTGDGAAQAIEQYLKALVNRDQNQMIAASCADWESQAKMEFDSFAAVKLNMQDLKCQVSRQANPFTLVTCTGSIVANYGAEDLKIDIAGRTYRAIQEGGDWRMCGYDKS